MRQRRPCRAARPIGRNVDAVEARPGQCDLAVRRVDARDIVNIEYAYTNDEASARDEERELAVVEPRNVQVGVAGNAELATAVINFGAAIG